MKCGKYRVSFSFLLLHGLLWLYWYTPKALSMYSNSRFLVVLEYFDRNLAQFLYENGQRSYRWRKKEQNLITITQWCGENVNRPNRNRKSVATKAIANNGMDKFSLLTTDHSPSRSYNLPLSGHIYSYMQMIMLNMTPTHWKLIYIMTTVHPTFLFASLPNPQTHIHCAKCTHICLKFLVKIKQNHCNNSIYLLDLRC